MSAAAEVRAEELRADDVLAGGEVIRWAGPSARPGAIRVEWVESAHGRPVVAWTIHQASDILEVIR